MPGQRGDFDRACPVPSLFDPRYSQSLERGLAILECFTPDRPVLGLSNIAQELGMSRPTTHRYMTTLVELGYLDRAPSRRYRLALSVTKLGLSAMTETSLYEHAHQYLLELGRGTGYTVSLCVLDEVEVVYVDRVGGARRARQGVDPVIAIGSRRPAYCTATGKLLLAYLPAADREQLLGMMKLAKHAPNTIISKQELQTELEEIRDEGFAVSDEELSEGVCAIAAPVRDESTEVIAAASLVVHTSNISLLELVDGLTPHLITAADRISARLGYRREDERRGPGPDRPTD